MNVREEGLGICGKCGTPIMQAIGQPGVKGVCFGCKGDGEEKTGRTVRVVSETGEGLLGKVVTEELDHVVGEASRVVANPEAVREALKQKAEAKGVAPVQAQVRVADRPALITVQFSIDELAQSGIVPTLLQLAYDAIDNMPPFPTMKETKRAIKLQEDIEAILKETKGE